MAAGPNASERPERSHIVFLTPHSFCILNIFPYNNGHVMVAPRRHVRCLSRLNDEELLELMRSVERARHLLDMTLKPDGFNIGINMGRVSGAGIPGHLHVHVVPRWNGDTNFMPVVCNTKVISQSIEQLYKILRDADAKTDPRIRK